MKLVNGNNDWSLPVECKGIFDAYPGCHVKLIINGDDIHRYDDVDGFSLEVEQTRYSITCPICGKETIVPTELIPEYFIVKSNAKLLRKIYYTKIM